MKNWLIAVVVAASTASVAADGVSGVVKFKGTQPAERALPLDPACGASFKKANPGKKPTTRFYVVGEGGGLGDVLVQIKGLSGGPAASGKHVIDQKGCEYIPYVSACRAGQTISVLNSDPVLHNVHPQPAVAGNKEYNKAQLPNGPALDFVYDNPEEFLKFKCDVHPWMYSYISVMSHGYFAVTDDNGKFSIAGVPDGTYEISAIHRKAGEVSQKVTVKGGKADVSLTLEVK